MENKEVKTKNYTVIGEKGEWLAQVVLTSDGMFASVTDYGNLSYAWRSFGNEDFRKFMSEIDTQYFYCMLRGKYENKTPFRIYNPNEPKNH